MLLFTVKAFGFNICIGHCFAVCIYTCIYIYIYIYGYNGAKGPP